MAQSVAYNLILKKVQIFFNISGQLHCQPAQLRNIHGNRHQKPKCSRGIPPSLLVSCMPLSVLLCFVLLQPVEFISL